MKKALFHDDDDDDGQLNSQNHVVFTIQLLGGK